MTSINADRTLLYGVVAVQNRLIHRKILAAALNVWVGDKTKSLGQILVEHGSLAKHQRITLEALVEAQLRGHDDDPIQGLTASSALWTVREEIQALADSDLDQVMDRVMARCCEDVEAAGSAPESAKDESSPSAPPEQNQGVKAEAEVAAPNPEASIQTEANVGSGATAEAQAEMAAIGAANVAHTATSEAPESQYLTLRQMLLKATKNAKSEVEAAAKPAPAQAPSTPAQPAPTPPTAPDAASVAVNPPRPAAPRAEAAAPFNDFVKALALDAFAARARGAGSNFDAVIPVAQAPTVITNIDPAAVAASTPSPASVPEPPAPPVEAQTPAEPAPAPVPSPEVEAATMSEAEPAPLESEAIQAQDQPQVDAQAQAQTEIATIEAEAETEAQTEIEAQERVVEEMNSVAPEAEAKEDQDAESHAAAEAEAEDSSGSESIGEIPAVIIAEDPAPAATPESADIEVEVNPIDSPSAETPDAEDAADDVESANVAEPASPAENVESAAETSAPASEETAGDPRPPVIAKSSFPFAQRLAEQAGLANRESPLEPAALAASESEPRGESLEAAISASHQARMADVSQQDSGAAISRGNEGSGGWLRVIGAMAAGAGLTAGLMTYWDGRSGEGASDSDPSSKSVSASRSSDGADAESPVATLTKGKTDSADEAAVASLEAWRRWDRARTRLGDARVAIASGDMEQARTAANDVLDVLSQPEARASAAPDGARIAGDLKEQAERVLTRTQTQVEAAKRDREIRPLRDSALLAALTPSPGRDVTKKRAACRSALDLLGLSSEKPLSASASAVAESGGDAAKAQARELIVVLAQSFIIDAPRDPKAALQLLDQAAALGPESPAQSRLRLQATQGQGQTAPASKPPAAATVKKASMRRSGVAATSGFDELLTGIEALGRHDAASAGEAATAFQKAVAAQPGEDWAWYGLGASRLARGEALGAVDAFGVFLQRRPNVVAAKILRAAALGQAGRLEEARSEFQAADADLKRTADDFAMNLMLDRRGRWRLDSGDLDAALADFRVLADRLPRDPGAQIGLARIHLARGAALEAKNGARSATPTGETLAAFDAAMVHLAKAMELGGESAAALRLRSQAQEGRGKIAEAIADGDAALRLQGTNASAADYLAQARRRQRLDQHQEAVAACAQALKIRGDWPEALAVKARSESRLGRKQDATRSAERCVAAAQAQGVAVPGEIHRIRAEAKEERRDWAGAAEDYALAIQADPAPSAELLRRRAYALATGGWDVVREDCEAALRANPNDADARAILAFARIKLGEHRQAVQDAQAAVAAGLNRHDLLYNLACVYAQALAFVQEAPDEGDKLGLTNNYRDEAMNLLRRSFESLPEGYDFGQFFRWVASGDPDLRPIRQSANFRTLLSQFETRAQTP